MLIHPEFNPVALQLGPLAVRWYGLMYLTAFLLFIGLGRLRIHRGMAPGWSNTDVDDMLFYGALGVVIGGRLGMVLFYRPEYYLAHPLEVFAVWKGGMAFHGGFIGVLLAMAWFARKTRRNFWQVTDFIAPLVPTGLLAGRIGNFINGELWGRPADPDMPLAMIFPRVDQIPRHPSQLYEAGLEGVMLFILLWWFASSPRPRCAVSGMFLIGYGCFRWMGEYFREPDFGIFGFSYSVSMGQWLSLPMVLAGIVVIVIAYRRKESS